MSPREKLRQLLADIFLMAPEDIRFDMTVTELPTWDSMAVISIAVAVNEAFRYHFTPAEAMSIKKFQDIITLLESKGISFGE
jgi:acyl carrier protein